MSKRTALMAAVGAAVFLVFATVSFAYAADQLRIQDQLRDRLQDGSCIAADQLRIQDQLRDRLQDGSCIAADQLRIQDQLRDRLQDGSCCL